jgi:2-methylcitrate dehydratase
VHIDRRGFLGSALAAWGAARIAPSTAAQAASGQQIATNHASSAKSLSRQFAQWVAGLRYEDLPAAVVDRVKGLTLQNLASALVGSQLPAGQQAVSLVTSE